MSELLQIAGRWSQVWSDSLWRASWQGGIAICLVWTIAVLWPSASPRVVCWLWRLVCVKVLVALAWVGSIEIPVLPAEAQTASVAPDRPMGLMSPGPAAEDRTPLTSQTVATSVTAEQVIDSPIGIRTAPMFLWSIGVAGMVVLTIREWRQAHKLWRTSLPAGDMLVSLLRAEGERLSVHRLPSLRLANVAGPVLVGIWRPTILLPQCAAELFSQSELRLIASHELAHDRRHDLAWNWLPTIVHWFLYFHPLVWLLKRGWFESQETACDELLIQSQIARPAEYGRLLVKLSALSPRLPRASSAAAGVLGTCRNLERRIIAMSKTKPFSRRNLLASAGFVLAASVIGVMPWRLAAQEANRAQKPSAEAKPDPGYELSHVVQFELGSNQLREGDSITIKEVRGTADTMSAGNMYQVKGMYKLHSAAKAQLAVFTTVDGNDPQSRQFEHVPTMKTQTLLVDEGEGKFTLLFYMWQDGWPHVSFYPAEGGNGMGGVYFGTGKSLLK